MAKVLVQPVHRCQRRALFRRPGRDLALPWSALIVRLDHISRHFDRPSLDTYLPTQLRPPQRGRGPLRGKNVRCFPAFEVGEETDLPLVDVTHQDHSIVRISFRINRGKVHGIRFCQSQILGFLNPICQQLKRPFWVEGREWRFIHVDVNITWHGFLVECSYL